MPRSTENLNGSFTKMRPAFTEPGVWATGESGRFADGARPAGFAYCTPRKPQIIEICRCHRRQRPLHVAFYEDGQREGRPSNSTRPASFSPPKLAGLVA
jgi:hypothetical protein